MLTGAERESRWGQWRGEDRWLEGSKGECEPEKLPLTHSAAHLGCEEIDGPFFNMLLGFSLFFFFLNPTCPFFVLTHIHKVKMSSGGKSFIPLTTWKYLSELPIVLLTGPILSQHLPDPQSKARVSRLPPRTAR